jgi:heme oxygenase
MADQETVPLSRQLREGTSQQHQAAEGGALQKALMAGALSRSAYAESLAQQWIVYRELESLLRSLSPKVASLRSLLGDEHCHAKDLAADLRHFGREPESAVANAATEAFLKKLRDTASSNPDALVGAFYVFEGSMNGGRHIARRVRQAYGLDAESREGTLSLDPYGADQPARWAAFKEGLDRLSLGGAGEAAVVAFAQATFKAIGDISNAVFEKASAS